MPLGTVLVDFKKCTPYSNLNRKIILEARAFTFTYPLTARVVEARHRWLHNWIPPFFSVSHCPQGLGELQACPFPDVVFPLLLLSVLSSFPFRCALRDGFERETCPYHFIWKHLGAKVIKVVLSSKSTAIFDATGFNPERYTKKCPRARDVIPM